MLSLMLFCWLAALHPGVAGATVNMGVDEYPQPDQTAVATDDTATDPEADAASNALVSALLANRDSYVNVRGSFVATATHRDDQGDEQLEVHHWEFEVAAPNRYWFRITRPDDPEWAQVFLCDGHFVLETTLIYLGDPGSHDIRRRGDSDDLGSIIARMVSLNEQRLRSEYRLRAGPLDDDDPLREIGGTQHLVMEPVAQREGLQRLRIVFNAARQIEAVVYYDRQGNQQTGVLDGPLETGVTFPADHFQIPDERFD